MNYGYYIADTTNGKNRRMTENITLTEAYEKLSEMQSSGFYDLVIVEVSNELEWMNF